MHADRDYMSDEELALMATIKAAAQRLVDIWHPDLRAMTLPGDGLVVVIERDPVEPDPEELEPEAAAHAEPQHWQQRREAVWQLRKRTASREVSDWLRDDLRKQGMTETEVDAFAKNLGFRWLAAGQLQNGEPEASEDDYSWEPPFQRS